MSDTERIIDDDVLEEAQFDNLFDGDETPAPTPNSLATPANLPAAEKKEEQEDNFTQWAVGGNSKFSPVGRSISSLVPGIYEPFATPGTWGLERMKVSSDESYELPDMATNTVLEEAERFW